MQLKFTIVSVEDLAKNLGISKKDFYLYLWKHSEQEIKQIDDFLLCCDDVHSIKK